MRDLRFIPECYIDSNIVETLLDSKGVNHQAGCYKVCSTMSKTYKDDFAVGIMDYDKKRPTYPNEFTQLAKSEHLKLLKHKSKHQYIIYICPACEQFILDCSHQNNINLKTSYKIGNNLKDLQQQTKLSKSQKDPDFKKLFKYLREYNPEFTCLKNVLNYLKENPFQADEKVLKSFFNEKD